MMQSILANTEVQLQNLKTQIRSRLHVLFRVGESIALVDTLAAFATHVRSVGTSYVRPKMGYGVPLVLKQCRHPLLEHLGEGQVVPNDVAISHTTNFQLITGVLNNWPGE
jgi:DNA mismatch repair ATPase MutS